MPARVCGGTDTVKLKLFPAKISVLENSKLALGRFELALSCIESLQEGAPTLSPQNVMFSPGLAVAKIVRPERLKSPFGSTVISAVSSLAKKISGSVPLRSSAQ